MDWTMKTGGPFQPGEEVGAYKASDWASWVVFPEGAPPGSSVAKAVIADPPYEGFVFKGLEENTKHYMGKELEEGWRWEPFWTVKPTRHATHAEIELEQTNKELEAAVKGFLIAPESPGTYTQTFSTAARTHAEAELATNLPTNLNIVTTLLGTLVSEVNVANKRTNEIAKALNEQKKLVNALIDDAQAAGIAK